MLVELEGNPRLPFYEAEDKVLVPFVHPDVGIGEDKETGLPSRAIARAPYKRISVVP